MSKSMQASSLAQLLETAKRNPEMTGDWSRLGSEVARWAERYPTILDHKHSLYRAAYRNLMGNHGNTAAQRRMTAAAGTVANALRQLGDAVLSICDTGIVGSIDPCNATLALDNSCPNVANHKR